MVSSSPRIRSMAFSVLSSFTGMPSIVTMASPLLRPSSLAPTPGRAVRVLHAWLGFFAGLLGVYGLDHALRVFASLNTAAIPKHGVAEFVVQYWVVSLTALIVLSTFMSVRKRTQRLWLSLVWAVSVGALACAVWVTVALLYALTTGVEAL